MIKLPAELTISQMQDAKDNILQQIESNDVIEIDDSEVVRIDTLGVQLILAIVTHVTAQNKQINWKVSSSVIKESIRQLGIQDVTLEQYL